ncbi:MULTISPECIES: transposase [unclassified Mesorhizobium]|uniref:transposase n=1 Tax=unclassified Mesorhizobium TaxID=325217 RepID=UPI001FE1AB4F|nr:MULTISPECIES: transposase [unclassified Mesorhizobium]
MARLARIVVPGLPHHVTQRGNGRAKVFFTSEDYALYKDLLVEYCRAADVGIWAWCLMPNHVHLILTPADPDGLRRALAKVHRAYAGVIHRGKRKPGISGKAASERWRWTRIISCRRYVMSG